MLFITLMIFFLLWTQQDPRNRDVLLTSQDQDTDPGKLSQDHDVITSVSKTFFSHSHWEFLALPL